MDPTTSPAAGAPRATEPTEFAAYGGADPSVLPRRLGLWSATAAVVGLMIGSGIFRIPSTVAASVDGVGAIALVWVLGGLLSLCGALTFGELAATWPEPGGVYVFLRETWGRLPAFLYGWTRLLVLTPSTLGALALIFASYLATVVPLTPSGERWVAAAALVVLGAINYRSVVWSALVENVASLVKATALLAIALAAFALADGSSGAFAEPLTFGSTTGTGLGLALVTVMWTYSGWAGMTSMAGEITNPGRNIPLAQLIAVSSVMAVYLAVNAAFLWVLPVQDLAATRSVAADVMAIVAGDPGAVIMATLVMVATFSAANASLMFAPRSFFQMARDGLLFKPIASVHPRYQTPHVSVAITVSLGLVYLGFRGFEELVSAFVLGSWPFYVLAAAGLIRMRMRAPSLPRPYRVWGYPVLPLAFVVSGTWVLVSGFLAQAWTTVLGLLIILTGLPAYMWLVKGSRTRAG